MTARILYRFHKNFDVCIQNLGLLKKLNPGIPVHGMYGGNDDVSTLPPQLTGMFDTLWRIPMEDPWYKWMHGDLCARWWFKEHGHQHAFDHLYMIEWDMLFIRPLVNAYGALKADCNYGSIFGNCEQAKKDGWYWIKEQYGHALGSTLRILKGAGREVDFDNLDFAIMGGAVFCRKFMEMYAAQTVPSHSNDEARFAVYSAAFKIPLLDNTLIRDPRNRYNADNKEYSAADLDAVIAAGGNVLHPFRIVVDGLEKKLGI